MLVPSVRCLEINLKYFDGTIQCEVNLQHLFSFGRGMQAIFKEKTLAALRLRQNKNLYGKKGCSKFPASGVTRLVRTNPFNFLLCQNLYITESKTKTNF